MTRRKTEIYEGSEVFKNGKFANFPTLNTIITNHENELSELLSIKLSAHSPSYIQQYNIETKRFITNFTTHQGLDLHLTQYDKKTKKQEIYSPYSNPGYEVFRNLLISYYENFKKRPKINFSNVDIDTRNQGEKTHDMPLRNFIDSLRSDRAFRSYTEHPELFKEDGEGVRRAIGPAQEENERREGIGFQGDKTIMKFLNFSPRQPRDEDIHLSKIIMENNLIPLYLQAFLDTNMSVGGGGNGANLKKVYEMLFYILEKEDKKDIDIFGEVWKNTPLTKEE